MPFRARKEHLEKMAQEQAPAKEEAPKEVKQEEQVENKIE